MCTIILLIDPAALLALLVTWQWTKLCHILQLRRYNSVQAYPDAASPKSYYCPLAPDEQCHKATAVA